MKSRWIGLGIILAIVGGLLAIRSAKQRPNQPLQTSYWFWQSPYKLTRSNLKNLKEIGVKQMFVRAGTFSSDGTNIVLIFPQKYAEGSNALPVHLVFNADAGVLRHFEDYKLSTIVPQISERIALQVRAARDHGVKVIGVQLDFDVPTRLLPRYSDLIKGIRATSSQFAKQKGFQFSMTGLMSWLGTNGLEKISNEVDFIVPQAYEGITGKTPEEMRPVFDPDDLKQRLPKAEQLNYPYWIGIPAYGHAITYDERGRLRGTYRNLEAQDALRHPSFRLLEAYPSDKNGRPAQNENDWVGEEILKFRAIKPSPSGQGLGYTIAFSLPTPKILEKAFDEVKQNRGPNCQGVIIYRMPEPGSSFTTPFESSPLIKNKKDVAPNLEVKVTGNIDAYEAVEQTLNSIPIDLYVEVKNIGNDGTFVAPDAIDIKIELDKPGITSVRLRDFDSIAFAVTSSKQEVLTSARNANAFHLKKGFLAAGEKCFAGPIRLLNSGDLHVKIKWRIRTSSGFSWLEHETPEFLLKNDARGQH